MGGPPRRSCIGCRTVRDKAELVRIHALPGGLLSVDLDGGAGRGAYVCPRRSCLERAVKRGEFTRGLRAALAPVEVESLQDLIRARAARKVLSLLGLARRGRKIVSGAEAVESAVRRRAARLILVATDASASVSMKLARVAVAAGVPFHRSLGKEELGTALGGAPRSCVALTDPHLANALASGLGKMLGETDNRARPDGDAKSPEGQADPWNGWR